jgi:hypothetical protein
MLTLEADYIARSEVSREVKWLLQLFNDIKHNRNNKNSKNIKNNKIIENNNTKPLPILCENEGTLAYSTNGVIKA